MPTMATGRANKIRICISSAWIQQSTVPPARPGRSVPNPRPRCKMRWRGSSLPKDQIFPASIVRCWIRGGLQRIRGIGCVFGRAVPPIQVSPFRDYGYGQDFDGTGLPRICAVSHAGTARSALPRIERSHPPRVLGVEQLQLLLDAAATDELVAGEEDGFDAAIEKALGDFAAEHVEDQI